MGESIRGHEGGVAKGVGELDGGAGVGEAQAAAAQDGGIQAGVQIGESVAELDRFAIQGEGALGGRGARRQVGGLQGEEPADTGALELDEAGGAARVAQVDAEAEAGAEQPQEQVEDVDANVDDQAAGFIGRALPGIVIPGAARSDIGEADVVRRAGTLGGQALAQGEQARMAAQLEDGVDAAAGFVLVLMTLAMNGLAIWLRYRLRKNIKW